jgi:plastocyanin
LGLLVGALVLLAACATPEPAGRVIPVVPGFPLSAESISVEPGEQLTWVNGDPARGEIRLEFHEAPNGPDVSAKEGIYTARFKAPGTYRYTVTSLSRTGAALVPRHGEVVVREAAPSASPPPAEPKSTLPPSRPAAPGGQAAPDVPPAGTDITRLQSGAEAYTAHRYQPARGIVVKVEKATAVPSVIHPGAQVILAVTYTILAPPDARPLSVRESRTVRFGDQDLHRAEKDVTVTSGTYASEYRLTVPSDAAEGPYTVMTTVEVQSTPRIRGHVSSTFSVSPP